GAHGYARYCWRGLHKRVHPPLPDACLALGLPPHPLLRLPHLSNPRQQYRAYPRASCRAAHSGRCHKGGQRHGFDERSARGAKSTRASMPLLRQQHAHHRDLLARATAETQAHANSAKDQDRHLMMTELMLDTGKYAQCLCWLPADNVIPCVVTSMLPFGKTQKRKIALQRRSVPRSQSNSRPCRVAKLRTLPPRSATSTPAPAAKSP